jgi:hypothetical protein
VFPHGEHFEAKLDGDLLHPSIDTADLVPVLILNDHALAVAQREKPDNGDLGMQEGLRNSPDQECRFKRCCINDPLATTPPSSF